MSDNTQVEPTEPLTVVPFISLNPYHAMRDNPTNHHRITLDMDRRDVDILKSVLVRQGSTTTAIYLFIKSISDYARINNLTLADAKRLEQHIIDTAEFGRLGCGKYFERECLKSVVEPFVTTDANTGRASSIGPAPSIPNSQVDGGHERRGTSDVHSRDQATSHVQPSSIGEQTGATKEGSGTGVKRTGKPKGKK